MTGLVRVAVLLGAALMVPAVLAAGPAGNAAFRGVGPLAAE